MTKARLPTVVHKGHGKINLLTAKSTCSRQNHFIPAEVIFAPEAIWKIIYTHNACEIVDGKS